MLNHTISNKPLFFISVKGKKDFFAVSFFFMLWLDGEGTVVRVLGFILPRVNSVVKCALHNHIYIFSGHSSINFDIQNHDSQPVSR